MASNELLIYRVVEPCPPPADPPIVDIEPRLSVELVCERDEETEVAQLVMMALKGIKSYYLFPEVENELTET